MKRAVPMRVAVSQRGDGRLPCSVSRKEARSRMKDMSSASRPRRCRRRQFRGEERIHRTQPGIL